MDGNVQDFTQLMDNLSNILPKLVKGVMGSVYSMETGKEMGKAVGGFYSEMVQAGIPPKDALAMAKDYMISINKISQLIGSAQQAQTETVSVTAPNPAETGVPVTSDAETNE